MSNHLNTRNVNMSLLTLAAFTAFALVSREIVAIFEKNGVNLYPSLLVAAVSAGALIGTLAVFGLARDGRVAKIPAFVMTSAAVMLWFSGSCVWPKLPEYVMGSVRTGEPVSFAFVPVFFKKIENEVFFRRLPGADSQEVPGVTLIKT